MDALKDWAMTLAGIIVFGSACETILPDGNFRKYVRLSIGLVLMLVLMSPIRGFVNQGTQLELKQISRSAFQQREKMELEQRDDVIRLYRRNLNEKIKGALIQRMGEIPLEVACSIEENEADSFGSIQHVLVLIDAEYGNNVTDSVEESLYEDFGVSKKKVSVRYLKESNQ